MKVTRSVRQLYENQKGPNDRLKSEVDRRLFSLKQPGWHYESRIKELTSFALKIETGRVENPSLLEDFFACTLVVTNVSVIEEAEQLIARHFKVKDRRPKDPTRTHKASDAFPFDDLRLYATLPEDSALPVSDLSELVFEVQIKTFLQHAWTIATHELVYKADDANWSKERIAYQIKAMLEHAEVSIQEAGRLAESGVLAKEDPRTAEIRYGIALLKQQWTPDELPHDVRRLAQNIAGLLRALRIEVGRLEEILAVEKGRRAGTHPTNLSPYAAVVQYLFDAEKDKMVRFLESDRARFKVLIPSEIDIPSNLDRARCRNAIFVGEQAP